LYEGRGCVLIRILLCIRSKITEGFLFRFRSNVSNSDSKDEKSERMSTRVTKKPSKHVLSSPTRPRTFRFSILFPFSGETLPGTCGKWKILSLLNIISLDYCSTQKIWFRGRLCTKQINKLGGRCRNDCTQKQR